MLWLLGIGRWLKEAATAAFRWICAHPREAVIIVLCVLSAWLWRGKSEALKQIAAIHAAQETAGTDQAAVNHAPAAKSAEIARKSDAEAPAYYDSVRRAATANSVRPKACQSSAPDLPRADSAVEGVHGPDPAADLVCRPAIEDSQIINAAGRAAEMHQEALDLIALGVAVQSE